MDLINQFMNLVAPPTAFFTLMLFLPPYLFFKSLLSVLSCLFSENLSGKIVLITGASSGIGEQLAYQYAKQGACLALVARRENSLREVGHRARECGSPDVLVIAADVSKIDDCERFVTETVEHFGRLDHLVNNAGIPAVSMFEDLPNVDNFRPIMDVNFWGTVYPTYFAIPHLKANKGKIVVTSSAGAWLPVPRMSFYNASKAALVNFFEGLRVEFGPDIQITIVTPGFIESEMTQGKFLSREGQMEVDQDMRDVQVGTFPVGHAEGCAKSIVNSVRRGDRYATIPFWYNITYYMKALCPEVLEWMFRIMLVTPGISPPLSKKILDMTGARNVLYPRSIQQPQVKTD